MQFGKYVDTTDPPVMPLNGRIEESVHYYLLNSTYQGHVKPHELLQVPAAAETSFTSALLEKVYTLVPLVWRCAVLPITTIDSSQCYMIGLEMNRVICRIRRAIVTTRH